MTDVRVYRDQASWQAVLHALGRHDYVHTFDFHRISERNGEGSPILFVVEDKVGRPIACWPALMRPVPGSDWFDLTSVYGYGGPLMRDDDWVAGCLNPVFDTMRELKIVTLFSRMHPLFNKDAQELEPFITKVSDVPIIDTGLQNKTLETYSKDHRRSIRRLHKDGFVFSVDPGCAGLESFVDLYEKSMIRLEARQYLRFSRRYFDDLLGATDFKVMLSFVRHGGVDVCAALNLITGNIMHGYLIGDLEAYRRMAPCKLDYGSWHEWALENGIQSFLLGPGRSQGDDTLLRFKQGFARLTLPLHIFRKVINPVAYQQICAERGVDPEATSYFPAYRTPL